MKSELRLITKSIAEQMLKRNFNNRRITDSHVEFLSQQMIKGQWLFDGQPIRFTTDGRLLDGQHRLSAVVKSDTSQQFLIVTGIESNAFKVMDTGRVRNAGDVLSIEGVSSYTNVAATIKSILNHKSGLNSKGGESHKTTNTDILNFFNDNKSIEQMVVDNTKLYISFNRVLPLSIISSMMFLMNEKNAVYSESFWKKVCNGTGLEDGSPIKALRDKLINDKLSKTKMTIRDKRAVIIKAWNFYRLDKKIKLLKFDSDREKFPLIK